MRRLIIILCLVWFPGRTGLESAAPSGAVRQSLVWPPAPASARIEFVSHLPGEMLAPKPVKSKLKRFWFFLVGLVPGLEPKPDRLLRPTGLHVRGGILYVADPAVGRVLALNQATGEFKWYPDKSAPALPSPVAVVVDSKGQVYVSDSVLKKIIVYNPKDSKILRRLLLSGENARPTGLALNSKENVLYVADTGNHRIEALSLSGEPLFTIGRRGGNEGEFNFPTYLWVQPENGTLWVCDSANFRVQAFDADGSFRRVFGKAGDLPGYLARPRGLATDSEGHLYAVDAGFEAVQIFDSKGDFLLHFGQGGMGDGKFALPGGITVDENDRLYVADTYNGRVQVFRYLKAGGTS